MRDPMLDTDFLNTLIQQHNKVIYARIISLTTQEQPVEAIEGIIQSGSINIDGTSAVRRVCNLTLTTKLLNINEIYWGFTTRIKIEVGLKNDINDSYDKIIWFPQGIFILTDFKTSQQVNNYTITLSGKDKMCLLNGDVGGNFNAETNLGIENHVDINGNVTEYKIPIKTIVREMIHHYAQEPWGNIIINNIDDYGLEMLDNSTNETLYIWLNQDEKAMYLTSDSLSSTGRANVSYTFNDQSYNTFTELTAAGFEYLLSIEEDNNYGSCSTLIINDNETIEAYYIIQVTPGQQIGYRITELTYDKELIAAPGDTVTSILDKLVKMLGSFEYFYNLEGQFVFQAKPTYLNTTWQAYDDLDTVRDLSYVTPMVLASRTSYYFQNANLITSIQNNPNMLNMRNDFTIWGKRHTLEGAEVPIHARYAIDKKPSFYYSMLNKQLYCSTQKIASQLGGIVVDWRELIYQMACDYEQFNHADEFEMLLLDANRSYSIQLGVNDYLTGKTGYEQYYHDIYGFWRLLYNPEKKDATEVVNGSNISYNSDGWNPLISTDPTSLIFWFDFYEINNGEMDRFSVPAIGSRPKVVNDDDVRVLMYIDVPDVIFATDNQYMEAIALNAINTGYSYITVSDTFLQNLSMTTRRKSAKEVLDNLLYEYTYIKDSISLTTIPMYHLQPNTIVHVYNELSHLDDYYEITKITLPLTYNGTMNISANKIPQQIY